MKLCANCNAPAEDSARFCGSCAQAFPTPETVQSSGFAQATMAARSCPKCGSTNAATARYCNECGTSMSALESDYQMGFDSAKVRRIAIISAVIAALAVIGLVIFFLIKPTYTPGQTVKEAVQAAAAGDIDRIFEFAPKKKLRQMMADELKKKGGLKEINIKSEKIDGDSATVEFEIVMGNGETNKETAKLIKEDGRWKVSMGPMF